VLRSFHLLRNPDNRISQQSLADVAIAQSEPASRLNSLLLPKRFEQYIVDVYFANFDPQGDIPLSRNSVAHGVADPAEFSLKGATLGFLALNQLSMYLRVEPDETE